MVKLILLRMLGIGYLFFSVLILCLAIAGPWMMSYGDQGPPIWIYFVIYPLALLIAATQDMCLKYFNEIM